VARKTITSAGIAASIGALCLCTLALYLNPARVLRREAPSLLLCLFLPWAAGGTLALALVAALATALRWWPRPFRPVIAGRPFFASLAFLALVAVAACTGTTSSATGTPCLSRPCGLSPSPPSW
jgi:hypothetical protein